MYPTKKEEIECADELKFDVVQQLKQKLIKEFKHVNIMDGVRVDLPDGWILIRPSNTSPIIRLTTEADNETILENLTTKFLARTHEIIENMNVKT